LDATAVLTNKVVIYWNWSAFRHCILIFL